MRCWLCVSSVNRAVLLPGPQCPPAGQQWELEMGDSMPSPASTPGAFAPDPDAAGQAWKPHRHQCHGAHTVPLCPWARPRVDLALPAASSLTLALSSGLGCWQDLRGNKSHLPSPSPSSNASAPLQGCRLLSFF